MMKLQYTHDNSDIKTTLTTDILNERYCMLPSIEAELFDKYKEKHNSTLTVTADIQGSKFKISIVPTKYYIHLNFIETKHTTTVIEMSTKVNTELKCTDTLVITFIRNYITYLHNLAKDTTLYKAVWNADCISKYPNVTGQVEIIVEDLFTGVTDYGVDYFDFISEEKGEEFCNEFNSQEITTNREFRKFCDERGIV